MHTDTTTPQPITKTLYSCHNGASKVYRAILRAQDGGWIVEFQNGKRGASLTTPKAKTASPLPYDAALKVFTKLVDSKINGDSHYVEDESVAVSYQDAPAAAVASGFLPQLLNAIDDDEVERYLRDDDWCAQEKADGERRPARKADTGILGINKKGGVVALALPIANALAALPVSQMLIDGEDLGDRLIAFDLLEADGEDLRELPYRERYRRLEELLGEGSAALRPVGIAVGETAKRALLAELRAKNAEGIVFKRREAVYMVGRPASGGDQIKFKFTASASCEVESVTEGKRSVSLRVYDDQGIAVPIGRVTIPANHAVPEPGAIVEVSYLYALSALFQPTYKGVRSDADRTDCTLAQIKFKRDEAALAA